MEVVVHCSSDFSGKEALRVVSLPTNERVFQQISLIYCEHQQPNFVVHHAVLGNAGNLEKRDNGSLSFKIN